MKSFLFAILVSIVIFPLFSQYVNVKINLTPVSGEEMIAINPKNTNQIVIGTHGVYPSPVSNMNYYYSTNSGLNWDGGMLSTPLGQLGTDPFVLVDTTNNFYYICIADWGNSGTAHKLDKLFCLKSTNGGMNWNNGTIFAQWFDHRNNDMPMACIDYSHSPYGNNIYVTWTLYDTIFSQNPADSSYVYFCRSTDNGNSFSTPQRIGRIAGHAAADNSSPEGPVPCTGVNGEIYVCFSHNEQIYFNRSTDGGNTWLYNDIIVAQQPGGWEWRFSPVVACDLSNSQYSGNVYICFSDLRNGINDRDIWLVRSTNGGDNWSNAVKVNNDSPGHAQDLPWVCVDRVTGYIWIVFYDSRNYTSSAYYDTYIARSTDGGSTFQNVKISNSSSSTSSLNWLGDYMGIYAYNNKVRPVWMTSNAFGNSYLWTAIIDTFLIGIQPINNKIPESYMLYQNYPNPFNPTTIIKYQVSKSSDVKLIVYDVLGQEVTTLVDEKLQPGTYEIEWNASNNPSGVYFYKLEGGDFTQTRKLIILK